MFQQDYHLTARLALPYSTIRTERLLLLPSAIKATLPQQESTLCLETA